MITYTRNEWGARPPKGGYTPVPLPQAAVIHHSAGVIPKSVDHAKAIVRGYQYQHMFTRQLSPRGAIDIAYHMLFDGEGNRYIGRPFATRGAHAPGGNDLMGICLLGNYDVNEPSRELLHAVYQTCLTFGIREAAPHAAFYPTACPGIHGKVFTEVLSRHLKDSTAPPVWRGYPHGGRTLRLVINGYQYSGWPEANNRIVSIARYPHHFTTEDCAIAWRGFVWRGNRDVANVCIHLTHKFNLDYR